jgi:YD repeat-containing protein
VGSEGFVLERLEPARFVVRREGLPTMTFVVRDSLRSAPLERVTEGEATRVFVRNERGHLVAFEESAPGFRARSEVACDARGRIVEVRRREHGAREVVLACFEYDREGCLLRATDANGAVAEYGYDAQHRMTRKVE